ncbi:unnamed protein product, partial [Tetraodon nigroviridis]
SWAPEDPQWLFLLTLFIASVLTIILYLLQYFQQKAVVFEPGAEDEVAHQEAASLLGWALSLTSWKSQWSEAWCRALSDQSRKLGGPVVLTFEEDGLEATELTVTRVDRFHKSARNTVAFSCHVTGEQLQFCVRAALESPTAAHPWRYTVCVAPLELQLDLSMEEGEDEVWISWGVSHLDTVELQVTPTSTQSAISAPPDSPSTPAVRKLLRQLLCAVHPSVSLSPRLAPASEVQVRRSLVSPPKPPRAHDWKLLVKNIQVTLKQQEDAAGSINPFCVLQLDHPPQKFQSAILAKNASDLAWDQPFIFELSGLSKELNIQLVNSGPAGEGLLLGQATVPFHLAKKQPSGQQTFPLLTKDGTKGSLTTEVGPPSQQWSILLLLLQFSNTSRCPLQFTYLEPSEVRSWHPPTPAYSKKVEMDRTVMPCGTVVTTVTAVKSKPGRALPPGFGSDSVPKATPAKSKLSERRVSEQASALGAAVSKALSSSDTELLMLNGADPVAEAALRQLHQSAKQKLKSPVKKSTIIISGIAKESESQEGDGRGGEGGAGPPPEDWGSRTEDLDPGSPSRSEPGVNGRKTRGERSQRGPDPPSTHPLQGGWDDQSPSGRQLPPEECQALLPEASSAQGARDEPVAQRPGVPGVSGRGGASAAHGHLQPSAAAQEQDEEQSQRFRLQGAAAHVNAL